MLLTDRYILKKFSLFFFYILCTVLFIFFIADIIFIFTNFEGVSLILFLKYSLFKSSHIIYQATPFGAFMAAIATTLGMHKNRELFILMSNGMSFKRICLPILGAVLSVSFLIFILNDQIFPHFRKQRQLIYDRDIRKIQKDPSTSLPAFLIKNKLWFFYKNIIFKINDWDQKNQKADQLTLFFLGKGWSLNQIMTAHTAYKKENHWFFYNGNLSLKMRKEDIPDPTPFQYKHLILEEDIRPNYLSSPAPFSHMSLNKLQFNIEQRKRAGLKNHSYSTEYHRRIHFIFMGCILSFFIFPLITYLQNRKGGHHAYGFATTLFISLIYLFAHNTFIGMGNGNILNPFLAVWLFSFLTLSSVWGLCYIQQKRHSKWLY